MVSANCGLRIGHLWARGVHGGRIFYSCLRCPTVIAVREVQPKPPVDEDELAIVDRTVPKHMHWVDIMETAGYSIHDFEKGKQNDERDR